MPGFRCENDSGCRLHTSAPELRLNPMSSDELQISYQHNFKFLISLFRGFSAPLSPVLTLHTQKTTKIKKYCVMFSQPLTLNKTQNKIFVQSSTYYFICWFFTCTLLLGHYLLAHPLTCSTTSAFVSNILWHQGQLKTISSSSSSVSPPELSYSSSFSFWS